MPAIAVFSSRRAWDLLFIGTSLVAVAFASLALSRLGDTAGLECRDYANLRWEGTPFQTRVEREFQTPLFVTRPAKVASFFSTECRGTVALRPSGTFNFVMRARSQTALWIDEQLILQTYGARLQHERQTVPLTSGPHRIRFRYAHAGRADEPELLVARDGGPLRPLNPDSVSREPLPAAAYTLRAPGRAAAVLLPLVWVVLVAYRLRGTIGRLCLRLRPVVSRFHHALTASPGRSLAIAVVVAVAVRVALTLVTHPILWPDSIQYYETALSYLRGAFLPHNLLSTPLFSAFLAAFLAIDLTPIAGVLLVATQHVLAVGATVIVYRLAQSTFDHITAFYATLLWTLSVVQLYYETVVTTEALFVFLLMVAILAVSRMWERQSPVDAALAGLGCAAATLTRPIAKGLVFVVLITLWWKGRRGRRLVLASTVLLATFYIGVAPWMYVNRQTYGFFGVSRGEGLWLFLRAIDIDELEPPSESRFPAVREVYDELRPWVPYLHYAVRDELNYDRRYSALQADDMMFGFARETVMAHPLRFTLGTIKQWVWLMINPYRSVQICDPGDGPHLCAERGLGLSFPAFPNQPPLGRQWLKVTTTAYFRIAYWIIPLLAPFAIVGIVRLLRDREPRSGMRVLLAATVLYLTAATAVFNTVQDRYRLPADAFIVMFAVQELLRHVNRLFVDPAVPGESQAVATETA